MKEIGTVHNDYDDEVPDDYKVRVSKVEVKKEYEDALSGIEESSHIAVLCWFDKSDRSVLRVHPMGDESNPLTGVFATRAPVRPNPVSYTVCELLNREGTELYVKGLDALEGTPVVDIKAYKRYDFEELEYPDWAMED